MKSQIIYYNYDYEIHTIEFSGLTNSEPELKLQSRKSIIQSLLQLTTQTAPQTQHIRREKHKIKTD